MKEVVLSPVAKKKLEMLLDYLEEEFSERTKQNFISTLEKIVDRIIKYPESFPESSKVKSVRRCIVSRYTVMYYRVRKNKIEILTFFDNRQNPLKSPY
jgi:plasmid stabilization system protein ParE